MPEDSHADRPLEAVASRCHGNVIAFEFSVYGERGERLGANVGGKPRIFEVGANEMLPGLESELAQMEKNESRTIVLSPEEAYGPVRVEAFREFPLQSIPEEARQVGRKVMGRAPDGSEDIFDVVEINGDRVVLDMNHPMAGRTIRFEVKVLYIECKYSPHPVAHEEIRQRR